MRISITKTERDKSHFLFSSVCVCVSVCSAHLGGLALFKRGARLLQTEGEEDGEGDVNKERSLLPAWTDNSSEERVEG